MAHTSVILFTLNRSVAVDSRPTGATSISRWQTQVHVSQNAPGAHYLWRGPLRMDNARLEALIGAEPTHRSTGRSRGLSWA